MPLQGVYGEYTPRSGAPQRSGSYSSCAGQCVTFRPARVHCDAAARLLRVRRHPPASRDHPARLEHGLPAHLRRESSRDCPSEACEREKKDCQGKSEGEGGRLGGEGALDLPPPDRRRGGPRKNRGDSSKNELVVLDLPQHGRATRELRGKVSHSRGPSARVKKFLHPGAFEGALARTCRRVSDLEKGLLTFGSRAVATAPLNQRKAPARPTCDARRGRGAVA